MPAAARQAEYSRAPTAAATHPAPAVSGPAAAMISAPIAWPSKNHAQCNGGLHMAGLDTGVVDSRRRWPSGQRGSQMTSGMSRSVFIW